MKPGRTNLSVILKEIQKEDPALFFWLVSVVLVHGAQRMWSISIVRYLLTPLLDGSVQVFFAHTGIVILLSALLAVLTGTAETRYEAKIGMSRICVFRRNIIEKLMRIPCAIYEDSDYRALIDRAWMLTWSNRTGIEGLLRSLAALLTGILTFLLLCLTLSTLHPLLPVLLLGIACADHWLLQRITDRGLRHREENAALDNEMRDICETLQDVSYGKEIRIMGMGDFLLSKHRHCMEERRGLLRTERAESTGLDIGRILLAVIRQALIWGVLIWFAWRGQESIADFTLHFSAAGVFSSALTLILTEWETLRREIHAAGDYRSLMMLDEESDAAADESQDAPEPPAGITVDNVSFRYPSSTEDVLHHISFSLAPGQKAALVGANGSGKTTLVRLLCGFLQPYEGRILFGHVDASLLPPRVRYGILAATFQDINLYALTLGQNTALAESYNEDAVHAALDEVGLSASSFSEGLHTPMTRVFDENGVELSGGQKQALANARTRLRTKALLTMLDEPTAALDPLAENAVYRQLREISAGKTVLFISHRLATTAFCDTILFLQDGHIAEQGTHRELMTKNGGYAAMFQAQSSYYQSSGTHNAEEEINNG